MGILRREGIEVLVDGNEADIPQAEILFDVVACVDGIPAQPGEIFHYYAVHKSGFNVGEHFLEGGAVKGGSAGAVVDIGVIYLDVRIALQKLSDNHLLGFDGGAVGVAVLNGQADINRGAAGAYGFLHHHLCAFFSAFSCHSLTCLS